MAAQLYGEQPAARPTMVARATTLAETACNRGQVDEAVPALTPLNASSAYKAIS
ncbi:MAG: hypothetical protein U1U88_000185 [Lawsonella clevelandensis]